MYRHLGDARFLIARPAGGEQRWVEKPRRPRPRCNGMYFQEDFFGAPLDVALTRVHVSGGDLGPTKLLILAEGQPRAIPKQTIRID